MPAAPSCVLEDADMAKARKRMPGERHEVPVMFYLTKPQKRGLDEAAEGDAVTMSV